MKCNLEKSHLNLERKICKSLPNVIKIQATLISSFAEYFMIKSAYQEPPNFYNLLHFLNLKHKNTKYEVPVFAIRVYYE